jgi:hypothetical protein
METVLVITSYCFEGMLDAFARPYLSYEDESAEDQAQDFWSEHRIVSDTGAMHTPHPLGTLSQAKRAALLRRNYLHQRDLAAACGRICALETFAGGFPLIPKGKMFGEWSKQKDARREDYAFLSSVMKLIEHQDLFKEEYLNNLFEVSNKENQVSHFEEKDEDELIHSYTRKRSLEDKMLDLVPVFSHEANIIQPIACAVELQEIARTTLKQRRQTLPESSYLYPLRYKGEKNERTH